MKLCHLCILKYTPHDNILDFPFKLYESKWALKADLSYCYNNNRNYLLTLHPEYNSNIVHELIYYISKSTYRNKLFRKQYIWALEILSEEPEFTRLCNYKNCLNEVPLECFIRKFEDKHIQLYDYIKNLLTNYTNVALSIDENEKVQMNPLIKEYTAKYHNFQTKLFDYFEQYYGNCISRCEQCNDIIDIFEDLELIGSQLVNDNHKELICLNINHIIIYREKCVNLSAGLNNRVNDRHIYILTYFYKLIDTLVNKIKIE